MGRIVPLPLHTNGKPSPVRAQLTLERRSRNASATGETRFDAGMMGPTKHGCTMTGSTHSDSSVHGTLQERNISAQN